MLSREEEARYGYLAAVNSTTLADGVALDLGGGSMQLTRVEGRLADRPHSWPLGAVRMTERFLPGERAKGKQLKALRAHVADELAEADWLERGGRLVGIGGTVRNLAVGRRAGGRAALLRRPGFGSRATRSTSWWSGWRTCPPRSARTCPASRRPAPT